MIRGFAIAVALCALGGTALADSQVNNAQKGKAEASAPVIVVADAQADTMRAKFAKGDRTPPSGYEVQGPTFYRINETAKGRGAWLPNSRPVGDAKVFWDRTDREGSGSAAGGAGSSP